MLAVHSNVSQAVHAQPLASDSLSLLVLLLFTGAGTVQVAAHVKVGMNPKLKQ